MGFYFVYLARLCELILWLAPIQVAYGATEAGYIPVGYAAVQGTILNYINKINGTPDKEEGCAGLVMALGKNLVGIIILITEKQKNTPCVVISNAKIDIRHRTKMASDMNHMLLDEAKMASDMNHIHLDKSKIASDENHMLLDEAKLASDMNHLHLDEVKIASDES